MFNANKAIHHTKWDEVHDSEKEYIASLIKQSPEQASRYIYQRATGEELNLENPVTFNEKIQWLKLYWQHPLVAMCADKYEARSFIKNLGLETILNPLYGVYDLAEEIDWNVLPAKFALKTTNSSGTNIICTNKTTLNKAKTVHQLNQWLKEDFSLKFAEIQYAKMKPRIIAERFIESTPFSSPTDYKFYCFNGVPEAVLIYSDRGKAEKKVVMDMNWNKMDVFENTSSSFDPEKPTCFEQMASYASRLSARFPFVRVDFYEEKGKPIFGELTFTPGAGIDTDFKDVYLKKFGELIQLPEKY